uniref:Uncharacterized protein n=1 Tax=viral metagenome TaxID=1070528 RepID=A0A6M3Y2W0_9ZZZZ
MSKLIRVDELTFNNLEDIRRKDETKSQVLDRLIDLWRMLKGTEPLLRGSVAFREFQESQKEVKV